MERLNGSKTINNCEFAILSIEKNIEIQCTPTCTKIIGNYKCDIKDCIKAKQKPSFVATRVAINEKNLGYNGHFSCCVRSENYILVDSDGFSYEGKILCESLNPFRYSKEYADIPLNSQANVYVIFPELPKKVEVSRILVRADSHESKFIEFKIANLSQEL